MLIGIQQRLIRLPHDLAGNRARRHRTVHVQCRTAHVDREWFAQAPYPRLQDWLRRILDSELFVAVMAKPS